MPGIDLIDLKDPLLHKREQGAIRLITHPGDECPEVEHQFWYLWTAKEAIFKAKRDLTNFNPKEIRVIIRQDNDNLTFESDDIKGNLIKDGDVILAIADVDLSNVTYQILERKTGNDSQEIREEIVKHFQKEYDLTVKVQSDGDGLPILDHLNLPLSLTHHARYMAFAYPKF